MKLARKLTFALLVGMCAVLAFHAHLQLEREAEFYEEDTKGDHLHFGHAIADAMREVASVEGEAAAARVLARVNEGGNPVHLRWVALGPEAGPAPASAPPEVLAEARAGHDASWTDRAAGRVYTYVPLALPGRGPGALELAESLEQQRRYSWTSSLQIVAATGAIAVISAGLAFVLGAWFVGRPIGKLIEAAQRIGAGDLAGRVDLRQRDEIGELARAMNAMADHLAAALEQLRHADRLATVGKLASGIAHELGTPLNVITGRAMMIRPGDSSAEEIAENARIVVEQSERMTKIIRQLLDFARPRRPEKAPADLAAIARSTIHFLTPLAEKRRVELALLEPGAPPTASVDAGQIQQVLANLVMNGIDAMPAGGPLAISIAAVRARPPEGRGAPEGRYFRIDVRDAGAGIAADVQQHLFEPFYTTKAPGEGTGLGLSVSHGIVREHGGWIAVDTAVGHGTCFSIFLPAEEAGVMEGRECAGVS
jgi:signal transduction histidine kinase